MAVHHAGLDPTLGLLHSGRNGSPGLAFDLMEPFRQPLVDRTVLGLVGRGARLEIRTDGDFRLRSRSILRGAIGRRLMATTQARPRNLEQEIRGQARSMRAALTGGRPFRAYEMTW